MPKHVFPSDNGIPYTVGRCTHPIFSYCGDEEYLRHLVHSARQNLWRLDLSSPSTILRMISSFLFHVRDTSIPYHYTKYFYCVKFLHPRMIFFISIPSSYSDKTPICPKMLISAWGYFKTICCFAIIVKPPSKFIWTFTKMKCECIS